MRARGTVLALAAVLALLLGWLLHSQYYWAREDTYVGYQGEAQDNPYLAAQRLLQRTGHPATCLAGLPDPLPPPGELLILPWRRALTGAEAARLADWVGSGGLLLARAAGRGIPDPLFQRFGVSLPPEAGPATFTLDGPALRLETGAIARCDTGRGRALLCASLDCLRNEHIAALDHADFLCALADLHPGGRVWIVTRDAAGTAWAWLWQRAWPALGALAALCLGALWALAPRFGPVLPDPDPARRSFLEHLDACGRYQWRIAHGRALLEAARAAFLLRLGQLHPAWAGLEPGPLCQALARRSGLPPERVDRALHHPAAHAAAFLEAVQTLHLLGRTL